MASDLGIKHPFCIKVLPPYPQSFLFIPGPAPRLIRVRAFGPRVQALGLYLLCNDEHGDCNVGVVGVQQGEVGDVKERNSDASSGPGVDELRSLDPLGGRRCSGNASSGDGGACPNWLLRGERLLQWRKGRRGGPMVETSSRDTVEADTSQSHRHIPAETERRQALLQQEQEQQKQLQSQKQLQQQHQQTTFRGGNSYGDDINGNAGAAGVVYAVFEPPEPGGLAVLIRELAHSIRSVRRFHPPLPANTATPATADFFGGSNGENLAVFATTDGGRHIASYLHGKGRDRVVDDSYAGGREAGEPLGVAVVTNVQLWESVEAYTSADDAAWLRTAQLEVIFAPRSDGDGNDDNQSRKAGRRLADYGFKLHAMLLSPYARTLFLDADTELCVLRALIIVDLLPESSSCALW